MTGNLKSSHTDSQTGRWTNGQTDRQEENHRYTHSFRDEHGVNELDIGFAGAQVRDQHSCRGSSIRHHSHNVSNSLDLQQMNTRVLETFRSQQ